MTDKTEIEQSGGNPFDPSSLRLSQNFADTVGVKKAVITIPVRRPLKQEFVRVHPEYRLETAVLELKEDRETYLVAPDLWSELSTELTSKVIFTTINRQGVLTLWPVRLPGEDGRLDPWNTSALEAAEMARDRWIRMSSNMGLGAYEVFTATSELPEPEWPEMEFAQILEVAFKGHYITALDHPVIRRLRGEL
jgi:hypothetical protein